MNYIWKPCCFWKSSQYLPYRLIIVLNQCPTLMHISTLIEASKQKNENGKLWEQHWVLDFAGIADCEHRPLATMLFTSRFLWCHASPILSHWDMKKKSEAEHMLCWKIVMSAWWFSRVLIDLSMRHIEIIKNWNINLKKKETMVTLTDSLEISCHMTTHLGLPVSNS